MDKHTCPQCGTEFERKRKDKTYCTDACYKRAKRAEKKANGFVGLKHGIRNTYLEGCRCEPCTTAALDYNRAWAERNRANDFEGREHGHHNTFNAGCRCADCVEAFRVYDIQRRERNRLEGFNGWEHGTHATYAAGCDCEACIEGNTQYYRDQRRSKGIVPLEEVDRACETCGTIFNSKYGTQRYCSQRCWPIRDSHWITDDGRLKLYERDGYTCYICGLKVSMKDEDYRTSGYATLDHVIPWSKGGANDPSNLRTCCWSCNSRKRDKTYSLAQGDLLAAI